MAKVKFKNYKLTQELHNTACRLKYTCTELVSVRNLLFFLLLAVAF